MSFKLRARRVLVGAVAMAMVVGLMPAGVASASVEAVCENAPASPFTDKGATHGANIDCMFAYKVPEDLPFEGQGIVLGRTSDTYEPFGDLTRGQAATLLVRFALVATQGGVVDLLDGEAPEFTDVEGTTHEDSIGIIADLGLILGFGDDTFRPNETITRGQFATVLFNAHEALGVEFEEEYDNPFTDTERFEIVALAGEGIFVGTTATTFSPFEDVRRGQTATMLTTSAGLLDEIGAWAAPRLPGPPTDAFTLRPELQSTEISRTVSRAAGSVQDPAGVYVEFNFNTDVSERAPEFDRYYIWNFNGDVQDADSATAQGNTVTAFFEDDDTELATGTSAGLAALSLASIDEGAAFAANGLGAIEASSPIGDGGTDFVGDAGVTRAPNLVSATGFRQGDEVTRTNVDFTFDKAIAEVAGDLNPAEFVLVLAENEEVPGDEVVAVDGDVVTVGYDVADGEDRIVSGDTARAYVVNEAVSVIVGGTTYENPLQSVNVTGGGATDGPDLVSVTFDVANNAANFTFSEDIDDSTTGGVLVDVDETQFFAYNVNGVMDLGEAGTAVINPANQAQVRVTFDTAGFLTTAVGAGVWVAGADVAVIADDDGEPALTSEIGVDNADAAPEAGEIDQPQLLGVEVDVDEDVFGNEEYSFIYEFDRDVEVTADLEEERFVIYLENGARYEGATCTSPAIGSDDAEFVTCTAYTNANQTVLGNAVVASVTLDAAVVGLSPQAYVGLN